MYKKCKHAHTWRDSHLKHIYYICTGRLVLHSLFSYVYIFDVYCIWIIELFFEQKKNYTIECQNNLICIYRIIIYFESLIITFRNRFWISWNKFVWIISYTISFILDIKQQEHEFARKLNIFILWRLDILQLKIWIQCTLLNFKDY